MPDNPRDLTVRHPEYKASLADWLRNWDVYRGGRHFISPGRAVGRVSHWREMDATAAGTTVSEESERGRDRRLVYQPHAVRSYLFSHARESKEEYDDRVARALHWPVFRSLVDIYTSAALRTEPSREASGDYPWQAYWDDVDFAGTKVDEFDRMALTYGLCYNKVFCVTDRPAFDAPAVSRGQQIERGERAYSYLVPPTDVTNWLLDSHGRFRWVQIREDMPQEREPGEEVPSTIDQYRVWYPDRWVLWRQVEQTGWVADEGKHDAGEVPVAALLIRRGHESRRTLEADGVLTDLVDADVTIFNLTSLMHDQIYSQCFAQLCLPKAHGESITDVELGIKRVLGYDAELAGQPLYLSPATDLLLAQQRVIGETYNMARQTAGVGRGRSEHSKEERSGDALREESADKNNVIASLAGAMEAFARTRNRHVAAIEGVSVEDAPKEIYSRDVSLKALAAQLNDAEALDRIGVPTEAMNQLLIPLFTQAMKEHGRDEASIQAGVNAIKARVEKVATAIAEVAA
jgi:hypothetical protein